MTQFSLVILLGPSLASHWSELVYLLNLYFGQAGVRFYSAGVQRLDYSVSVQQYNWIVHLCHVSPDLTKGNNFLA